MRKPHPAYLWDVPGRLARLLELHAQGWSSVEIGADLGVNPATVRGRIWRLGLATKGGASYKYVRKEGGA